MLIIGYHLESHRILEFSLNNGIYKVIVYLDDIAGVSEKERFQNLNNVLHRGLHLKEKYKFFGSFYLYLLRCEFQVLVCVYEMCKYKYSTLKCLLQLV